MSDKHLFKLIARQITEQVIRIDRGKWGWRNGRATNIEIEITDDDKAYSEVSKIYIGVDAPDFYKASIYDLVMHELLHIKLDHHDRDLWPGWSHEQINIAGDLEINSTLSITGTNMIHPDMFGLPVGLTTEEYLELLFPEGPQGGELPEHFQESEFCGRMKDGKVIGGEIVKDVREQVEKLIDKAEKDAESKKYIDEDGREQDEKAAGDEKILPDLMNFSRVKLEKLDKTTVSFINEAKQKSIARLSNSRRVPTYHRMYKGSAIGGGLILPGQRRINDDKTDGQHYVPLLFIDISSSTEGKINEYMKSIVRYAHKDFVIATYNGGLTGLIKPSDKQGMVTPVGGTNATVAGRDLKRDFPEMWERIDEVFYITDGEDDMDAVRTLFTGAGKKFSYLRVAENYATKKIRVSRHS